MDLVARPCIAAGVALAAGSLIAVTPVMPALSGVQVPDVQLSADSVLSSDSILQAFLDQELESNSGFTPNIPDINDGLADDHVPSGLAALVPGSDAPDNVSTEATQSLLDAYNQLFGGGEGSYLGLLGIGESLDPETLSPSVPVLDGGGIQLGGIEGGGAGHSAVFSNELSALAGGFGDHAIATALLTEAAAFNEALLAQEEAFNTQLVESEQALQGAVFGDDHALNDVVDRAFNVFNMIYAVQQQGVNGLLGVEYDPQELAQLLLLTGDPDSDQFQALMAALADLKATDFEGVFANFDGEEFQTALEDFFTTVGGGPFGDAFDLSDGAPLAAFLVDFSDIFDTLGIVAP